MAKMMINNTEYYYELHGNGQPLVMVAGYASDHRKWTPILDQLAKTFQVLIFDNRGIGQTRDEEIDLNAELMAADTMQLINKLGIVAPFVIGHSMGGTIVQALAAHNSEKISKIALLQSSCKWRHAMLNGLASLLLMRKENISFDTQFIGILSWVFGQKFLADQEKVAQLKQIILTNEYPQSIADQERQFNALVKFDSSAYLNKINIPTLVISGVEDIISLPQDSLYLAQNIKNAKLVTLNCGHDAITERPNELVDLLTNFA